MFCFVQGPRPFRFSVLTTLAKDDSLAKELKNLRFLVLDEADRMIESGHFAELENILRLTLREDRCVDNPWVWLRYLTGCLER